MLTAALVTLLALGQATGGRSEPSPTARSQLTVGQLFIPAGMRASDGPIGLIVHLHGSGAILEENLSLAKGRRVLVTVSLNGLSSVYTRQFADPLVFEMLVSEAARKTAPLVGAESIEFSSVTVSSFSAGFGGVRELLKSPECFQRIDAIVMADSIYAGYAEGLPERRVDPALMAGFLKFAREAVAGRKQLVISHCALQPDGYASTAETADYLLRELKLTRQPVDETWAEQWHCTSRCEQEGFHLFGFTGTEGTEHLRHLRNIGRLWSVLKP
jgi:hypothetical protein